MQLGEKQAQLPLTGQLSSFKLSRDASKTENRFDDSCQADEIGAAAATACPSYEVIIAKRVNRQTEPSCRKGKLWIEKQQLLHFSFDVVFRETLRLEVVNSRRIFEKLLKKSPFEFQALHSFRKLESCHNSFLL